MHRIARVIVSHSKPILAATALISLIAVAMLFRMQFNADISSFALTGSEAGEAFVEIYPRILERRKDMVYGERERDWQTLRRGRYVEFNLLHDRGTKFGLAVGGRTERVLASMPPIASWAYCHEPEPGSPEAALLTDFLRPRDWLGAAGGS